MFLLDEHGVNGSAMSLEGSTVPLLSAEVRSLTSHMAGGRAGAETHFQKLEPIVSRLVYELDFFAG